MDLDTRVLNDHVLGATDAFLSPTVARFLSPELGSDTTKTRNVNLISNYVPTLSINN